MDDRFMDEMLDALEAVGTETDAAITRFMNDDEMYLKYICAFPDEPTMQRLRSAVAAEDYPEAQAAVHALKGIVNNLGLVPLGDAAVDMLAELRANNIPDALEAYKDVETQYTRVCNAINAHKANAEAE